mmetsp:Transcript_6773/g.12728  ORF Transcript_6773/g.12728 Transcript_6773/m.12728 type:complete len:214 (+) Transcript_6773:699-1340(+)
MLVLLLQTLSLIRLIGITLLRRRIFPPRRLLVKFWWDVGLSRPSLNLIPGVLHLCHEVDSHLERVQEPQELCILIILLGSGTVVLSGKILFHRRSHVMHNHRSGHGAGKGHVLRLHLRCSPGRLPLTARGAHRHRVRHVGHRPLRLRHSHRALRIDHGLPWIHWHLNSYAARIPMHVRPAHKRPLRPHCVGALHGGKQRLPWRLTRSVRPQRS